MRKKREYKKKEILEDLDNVFRFRFFPNLENPYFYTSGSRINLFADNKRWAIIFELSGFNNISCSAELQLYYFGNCLVNLPRTGPKKLETSNRGGIILVTTGEFEKIEEEFFLVSKDATHICVRDKKLQIEHDPSQYSLKGIEINLEENPECQIDFPSLIRYLEGTRPDLFRASDKELTQNIPGDLPFLMKIDKWHHKTYTEFGGVKPSSYETFQMVAEIIMTGNTNKWVPTMKPNNNWRNWPKAGSEI